MHFSPYGLDWNVIKSSDLARLLHVPSETQILNLSCCFFKKKSLES